MSYLSLIRGIIKGLVPSPLAFGDATSYLVDETIGQCVALKATGESNMYFSTFLAICFFHVHNTRGSPKPGLNPALEQRLTAAATSIKQGYEQQLKPAMEGIISSRLEYADFNWFRYLPNSNLGILSNIPTATLEQQIEILAI